MKRKTLGELLLEMGAIDELQLAAALAHHRQWGVPLGRALIEKRLCGQDHIVKALQRQTGLPLIDLRKQKLSTANASLLSLKVAQQHRVVPLRQEGRRGETLVVAIAAPASLAALDAVQHVSGKSRVVAHLASDEDIAWALSSIYGVLNPMEGAAPPRFGTHARVENEQEFDIDSAPEQPRSAVILYGWPAAAAEALTHLIRTAGFDVRTANDAALCTASTNDVVLAPLPSIEAAAARGVKAKGKLIVAGKNPDAELERAQRLSACGFIPAPLDSDFVLHVLRRVQRREEAEKSAAHA